jgi:hypothetical protein
MNDLKINFAQFEDWKGLKILFPFKFYLFTEFYLGF